MSWKRSEADAMRTEAHTSLAIREHRFLVLRCDGRLCLPLQSQPAQRHRSPARWPPGSTLLTPGYELLVRFRFSAVSADEVLISFSLHPMANTSSKATRPADKQGVTSPAKPVARFGTETVSAAVFKEQRTTRKGVSFDAYNVSLRRSYKKADGSFGNTHTREAKDLQDAIDALKQCVEFIIDQPEAS